MDSPYIIIIIVWGPTIYDIGRFLVDSKRNFAVGFRIMLVILNLDKIC